MSQLDAFLTEDDLPPSPNRNSRVRIVVTLLVLAIIAVVVWTGFVFVRDLVRVDDYPGPGTGEVQVVVERGDSLTAIARTLVAAGVVQSTDAFLNAAEAESRSASIGPGRYVLRSQMSGVGALDLMLSPQSRAKNRLVLPEGLSLEKTIDAASEATDLPKSDFQAVLDKPDSLGLPDWSTGRPEGFLFPASYDIAGDEDAAQVLRTLVNRFDQASTTLDLVDRAKVLGRAPYEVLIVASLLQAEGIPNDYAKVARVIYNRLDAGMPLQLDSTVNYALGTADIQLSDEQLATDSPYNTYANAGLPPTPINSPGEAAIEAALSPAKGKWLYFVTVDPKTGETKFTKSYDKFLEYKREFQDNLRGNP